MLNGEIVPSTEESVWTLKIKKSPEPSKDTTGCSSLEYFGLQESIAREKKKTENLTFRPIGPIGPPVHEAFLLKPDQIVTGHGRKVKRREKTIFCGTELDEEDWNNCSGPVMGMGLM